MRFPRLFTFSLILGLLLSGLLAWHQSRQNRLFLDGEASYLTEQLSSQIQFQLQRYQYGLRGARGVILSVSPDVITRDTFLRYSRSRDLKTEFPGARGVGFIRRVKETDVARFVETVRADDASDYHAHQMQPHAGDQYLIQFIEPEEPNKSALGLDIASETERRNAAHAAMHSGVAQLTGPITLVQPQGTLNQAFLLLLPVYKTAGTPSTDEGRMNDLIGWTYAPLYMPEVLAGLDAHGHRAELRLSDMHTAGTASVIFDSDTTQQPELLSSVQTRQIEVFGRHWQVEVGLRPEFVDQQNLIRPDWLFILGALISILLACLLEVWRRAQEQREVLIAEQAHLAAIVSSSSDGIISKTLQGEITSWNSGATDLFGYTAAEAVGKKLVDLIVPTELRYQEKDILEAIARGEKVTHFQTRRQRKDGSMLDVSVNVSPIFDSDNRVIGASKTVRDISLEKEAEQRMLDMNIMLEQQVAERTLALEKARSTLQTVLDAVPSVIGYCDKDLINQVANKAFIDWFGRDPATVPGTPVRELIGPQAYATSLPYIEAALAGEIQTFERTMPRADGQGMRHALVQYLPDIEQGEVRGFYILMYDITEITNKRLQLDAAMRENEALLSTINQKMLSSVTAADGTILSVNENFCKASGYSQEELVGQNHIILNSGVHPPAMWKSIWSILVKGQSWQGEICNRTKDGSHFWLEAVVSPFLDANGKVERYVGLYSDITLKKAAEDEIKRLNILFSNVLEAASEISIIATDIHGIISIFNAGAERMLGYRADEMVGKATPSVLHLQEEVKARSEELSAEYGQPIQGFRTFVYKPELEGAEVREWTYVRKNGSLLTVSLAVTAIYDDQRQLAGYLGLAIDVTQQHVQQRKLAFASEQLVKAAKVADLGVWSWNIEDDSLEWNERMFDMYHQPLSLKEHGLNYQHWRTRVHEDDVDAAETNLQEAVAGRGIYDVVFRLRRPDGQIQYIQAGGLVERDEQGRATRVTGINRDITAQRELETQLRLAKKNADDASAAKSRFLANMSHEIRTPMNAVLGMLQLIRQTQLTSRQQDYIVKAHTAAKSLLGLLNDILDFSKIDAGKLELDAHPFEFEELMRDLGVVLSGNQGDKDVEVMFDLSPDIPAVLVGDRLRLQQVLFNLAGNALKFTHEGHVVVSVKLLALSDAEVSIRIAVSDTGIGISKEQLARIFDGFVQAETSTTRRYGGSGLGLVISKRLIAMMGGELQVDSTPGEGSRFHFDLRLPVSDARPAVPDSSPAMQDLRILLVDDNPVIADILLHTIKAMGWHADQAHGGHHAVAMCAIALASERPYQLILMDWRMPDLDGLAAARQIQSLTDSHDAPIIIMVSAYGSEILSETRGGTAAPFYELLTKPVTPQQLLQSVQRAVSGTPAATEALLPTPAGTRRLDGIRLLVVEDNALNRQVAFELLSNQGAIVELAEGGTEGVAKVTGRQREYDVIIMDVQMPDMDGREATRHIRADGRFANLPILAVTADAAPADRDACLAAGMNAHIGKPIDLETIVPAILQLLGRNESPPQPQQDQARQPPKPGVISSQAGPELAALRASTNTDTDTDTYAEIEELTTVLKRFSNQFPMYQSIFELFEPEVHRLLGNLIVAIRQVDNNHAKVALHSLKGVAATVGASGLARRAGELESMLKLHPERAVNSMFSDSTVTELRNLLDSSLVALNAATQAYKSSMPPTAPVMATTAASTDIIAQEPQMADATSNIKQELTALLPLVKSNNLSVLDKMDALYSRAGEQDKQKLTLLVKQINALDFPSAAQTITTLLTD
ncbi:PAS domain S-box protein [Undibacterium sp. TS12]|uniref:PAS domain S-box protein n=1 Tax=Undibacterium sp. TS12 TaxID=2908202 RepID=UPI001F4CDAE4|nr:PAS domain S-box protein [Undibacterium sp. TS12]MCH8620488.1 PAS domain S-box protein [Undibacterium sp. TS12]